MVTGGASGIGRACVQRLAADGAHVVVVDRDAEAAQALAEQVGGSAVTADLSDLDELLHRVRDAGLPVRYEVHGGNPEVPPAIQLAVYRLVQEALTNTMKHAGRGVLSSASDGSARRRRSA